MHDQEFRNCKTIVMVLRKFCNKSVGLVAVKVQEMQKLRFEIDARCIIVQSKNSSRLRLTMKILAFSDWRVQPPEMLKDIIKESKPVLFYMPVMILTALVKPKVQSC